MKKAFTLAGRSNVNILPKRTKWGFTLAEVLITLGIIGVVAALTIPGLTAHYQKRVWTTQLQKSYSTLNQGFRQMLADDNASGLSQTETFLAIQGNCAYNVSINDEKCKNFFTNLRKYFKIATIGPVSKSKNYNIFYLNGSTRWTPYQNNAITFVDGSSILEYIFSQSSGANINNTMEGSLGSFTLDINGLRGPNKYGRDIFIFYIGDNGKIYPKGSKEVSEFVADGDNEKCYWRTGSSCITPVDCSNKGTGFGGGCAARVLEEKGMNY